MYFMVISGFVLELFLTCILVLGVYYYSMNCILNIFIYRYLSLLFIWLCLMFIVVIYVFYDSFVVLLWMNVPFKVRARVYLLFIYGF
jgi:hypothetical protein